MGAQGGPEKDKTVKRYPVWSGPCGLCGGEGLQQRHRSSGIEKCMLCKGSGTTVRNRLLDPGTLCRLLMSSVPGEFSNPLEPVGFSSGTGGHTVNRGTLVMVIGNRIDEIYSSSVRRVGPDTLVHCGQVGLCWLQSTDLEPVETGL